jgi:hypothetical protein
MNRFSRATIGMFKGTPNLKCSLTISSNRTQLSLHRANSYVFRHLVKSTSGCGRITRTCSVQKCKQCYSQLCSRCFPKMLFTLNRHYLPHVVYVENYHTCVTVIMQHNVRLHLIYIKLRTLCGPTVLAPTVFNWGKYPPFWMLYHTRFQFLKKVFWVQKYLWCMGYFVLPLSSLHQR